MSAPPVQSGPSAPAAERRRGYQRWRGERTAQAWRWWVIARGNLSLALASRWVKVMLVASLIPGVVVSGLTYFFLPLSRIVLKGTLDASLLFAFIVAALVGARLVSEDRRQGAFLAHFTRPVTRLDYVLGKVVALALPLLFVTTASGLFAIAADASVPESKFRERIDALTRGIPTEIDYLREASYAGAVMSVLGFGLVASLATTGIVLGLSALSTRARIAGIVWFAVVAFGSAAHAILSEALPNDPAWPALLSWFDNLSDAGAFLLGLSSDRQLDLVVELDLATRLLVLAAAAAAGLAIVHEQLRRAEGGVR